MTIPDPTLTPGERRVEAAVLRWAADRLGAIDLEDLDIPETLREWAGEFDGTAPPTGPASTLAPERAEPRGTDTNAPPAGASGGDDRRYVALIEDSIGDNPRPLPVLFADAGTAAQHAEDVCEPSEEWEVVDLANLAGGWNLAKRIELAAGGGDQAPVCCDCHSPKCEAPSELYCENCPANSPTDAELWAAWSGDQAMHPGWRRVVTHGPDTQRGAQPRGGLRAVAELVAARLDARRRVELDRLRGKRAEAVQALMQSGLDLHHERAAHQATRDELAEARSELASERAARKHDEGAYRAEHFRANDALRRLRQAERERDRHDRRALAANQARDKAVALLGALVDPDDCRFDHHGGCQEHGFLELEPGERCPNAEAKELLAELRAAGTEAGQP